MLFLFPIYNKISKNLQLVVTLIKLIIPFLLALTVDRRNLRPDIRLEGIETAKSLLSNICA